MNKATQYLHSLPQISKICDSEKYDNDVFLFPPNIEFSYQNNIIVTNGLGMLDRKKLDLIRVIEVENALELKYNKTNILTPLVFAENCYDIPWHLNTQSFLFSSVSEKTIEWIKFQNKTVQYGKHEHDKFWLPFSKDINELKPGDIICVFNRRVAGWDGTPERPVIELLGAGGHLPTIWESEIDGFIELSFKENLKKEFFEELGEEISNDNIMVFGGYKNEVTHELVVLCGIELPCEILFNIQDYTTKNIEEDSRGIYLGTFEETISYYMENPVPFAGGKKAAPYNFPNRKELMQRVKLYFDSLKSDAITSV